MLAVKPPYRLRRTPMKEGICWDFALILPVLGLQSSKLSTRYERFAHEHHSLEDAYASAAWRPQPRRQQSLMGQRLGRRQRPGLRLRRRNTASIANLPPTLQSGRFAA